MNNSPILIEEILQVYDSFGNRHLVCGTSSGELTSSGKDIHAPSIHLVIPIPRLQHILNQLNIALKLDDANEIEPDVQTNNPMEFTGKSIMILNS